MASVSALRKRVERLQTELERRKARAANYESVSTSLPTVANWLTLPPHLIRTSGTVAPFDPYTYQEELVRSINANPNTLVNKSRQTGVSETVCNYLLDRALTERGFAAVIFSKTQQDASELGRRVRAMANSLRGETIRYLTDSTTQLAFEGRGTLYFLPASPRAARGIPSCSVLFMDEAAFLEGAAEIYRGAMPTLHGGRRGQGDRGFHARHRAGLVRPALAQRRGRLEQGGHPLQPAPDLRRRPRLGA